MNDLPPVLIVDDEPDDIFVLKRLLTKAAVKNKAVGFEDALAAFGYLQSVAEKREKLFIPCLVFSDLHMPKLDGLSFLEKIRGDPLLKDLPFVIMTSLERSSERARAESLGVASFWEKFPPISAIKTIADQFCCGYPA
jgi:CheY-like chemotaxis protein